MGGGFGVLGVGPMKGVRVWSIPSAVEHMGMAEQTSLLGAPCLAMASGMINVNSLRPTKAYGWAKHSKFPGSKRNDDQSGERGHAETKMDFYRQERCERHPAVYGGMVYFPDWGGYF